MSDFDLERYIKKQTEASGVPLKVQEPSILASVANVVASLIKKH